MLSVSLSYILDYSAEDKAKELATHHHQQAIWHTSQELKDTRNRLPGNGDSLVACLILLGHTEVSSLDSVMIRSTLLTFSLTDSRLGPEPRQHEVYTEGASKMVPGSESGRTSAWAIGSS